MFIYYSSPNGIVNRKWEYETKRTLHSVLHRDTSVATLQLIDNSPILWMCFYFDGVYSIDSVEYMYNRLVFKKYKMYYILYNL